MKARGSLSILAALALLLASAPVVAQPVSEAANSCVRCHAEMGSAPSDPVPQWQESIHAANGIGCNNCHGGDPTLDTMESMSPERGFVGVPAVTEIPSFCGECHAGVLEDYLASAHGKALGSGGPTCVDCHGNHAVRKATPDLINETTCTQCHGYERAGEIKAALAQTDAMISSLEQEIAGLHRVGIVTEDLRNALFAVRNDFHRLFHSVDVQRIVRETAGFEARLREIREPVQGIAAELQGRRTIGYAVTGLLAVTTVIAWLLRRTYRKEEERGT